MERFNFKCFKMTVAKSLTELRSLERRRQKAKDKRGINKVEDKKNKKLEVFI